MNLVNELMRSAPRRRNEIPSRLVGSAHQVDKPDQRGLSPTRVRKTFRKAYPSNRRLGATAGLGLCWAKLMRSPLQRGGQNVQQPPHPRILWDEARPRRKSGDWL